MIPSAVASEVADALRSFLRTGFGPSNPELAGVIDDFLTEPENLVKGPYLSIALPYRHAPEGGEPFPEIPLGYTPYRHQRTAFSRLAADAGRSTVIATGTGSGKTECFLLPILDYCREQASTPEGRKGIKAILIYPMNALATDQARRIAKTIYGTPSLRGRVTAGLFIGQAARAPQVGMGPEHIVADRESLLEQPPDILLTNYKMLDYLLVRPSDQRLWRFNEPGTLRYLAVDELHAFDGAQGTDLACLIRRLRARLGASEGLICAGTSATLGGEGAEPELREYASRIFAQPFEPGSIVGETRQSIDEFLGGSLIGGYLMPGADLAADLADVLDRRRESAEDYIRGLHELFFDVPIEGGFESDGWRVALADRLREHATFVNLLRVLDGRAMPVVEVANRLRRSLPVAAGSEALAVLDGLCALISVARRREGGEESDRLLPFLQVGLHLWVRELRRMVCSVYDVASAQGSHEDAAVEAGDETSSDAAAGDGAVSGAPHRLRHSDDLKPDDRSVHLPLIQCRECRATGWGAVKRGGEERVERDLRVFYNRFFARDVDVQYFFPGEAPSPARGIDGTICGGCGRLTARPENAGKPCAGCGGDQVLRVFRPDAVVKRAIGGGRGSKMQLSRDCPYCGAGEALIVFGARASSLLGVALGQTFASRHNDDRKVIAFSDNVQDAAHRAGFVAARTWPNNVRAAIAQVVEEHGEISLSELIGGATDDGRVVARWRGGNAGTAGFGAERFVSEFIAPDRLWLRDFAALRRRGRLPRGSDLPELVARRLRWEAFAEFGHRSTIGRTLERTRAAAIGVDRERFDRARREAWSRIREIGGFREIEVETVRALLLGILRRMKNRGAIWSDLVEGFLASGASRWWLTRQRALQDFGPRSPLPVFPADRPVKGDGLAPLLGRPSRRSWYRNWTIKVLSPLDPLSATHDAPDVLAAALESLESAGLVRRVDAGGAQAWALDPASLYATSRVAVMRCEKSNRVLVVPAREVDIWRGVPCLDLAADDVYGGHEAASAPSWFGRLYRKTAIRRLVAAEHTALLTREERAELQERFADPESKPWAPNVLSATPTLELGIDIGDLSTVVLCSVPPARQNYVQRIGRAGRRDGNAFTLTVAAGRPHDLYFYEEPLDMLGGSVEPPGVFLNASAVLERQLTAFCFDGWAATGIAEDAVPRRIRPVLDSVEGKALDRFPHPLFDFVRERAEALLDGFFSAFSDSLDEASKTYLRGFLLGDAEGQPSLRLRLLERFLEVAEERKSLRAEIEALRRRIAALRRDPPDEATGNEIRELAQERGGLQRLLRDLNGRNTFNFLTDEGLLPNYAFPEAGVTLKSVIYRRRERRREESGGYGAAAGDAGFEYDTYEYMRPAASALGELAPENRFYAGGRRVRIDRIDLRLSGIETWRLCASCSYCERVDVKDEHGACPRCGDGMWADAGQRRSMLPLRLVHAFTPDRRSRIVDERDDREPLFYTRQLVADFEPRAVERAYAMPNSERPFGFEYISSATFREMNFGRLGQGGQPTMFAGVELPRDGFRVCTRCGKVQGDRDDDPVHARTCPARSPAARTRGAGAGPSAFGAVAGAGQSGDGDIEDCLYLYRQFRSEAVRMLLPAGAALGTERRVASFVASLELGLKRWFSGRIDHLRAMTSEYPDAGTNTRRRYLMLYDTVPGGTGYLKELMSEPSKLLGVFETALDALVSCPCNQDPEKDGCYRCVFAYRRGRDMASTSRTAAVEILQAILAQREDLEEVEGLAAVNFAQPLESELEERLVAALSQVRVDGEPVRLRRDLVRGCPGYVLTVAGSTWYMAPQVDLGLADGVAAPSRPDFVIRPARTTSRQQPIAVFTDGFEFHRDRTDDDSLKRMALVRAGYLAWSLTWRDVVEDAAVDSTFDLAGNGDTDLQVALDQSWGVAALRARFAVESSLKLLARYLAKPDPEHWKRAVFASLCGLFDSREMLDPGLRSRFESRAAETLPDEARAALADLERPVAVAGRGAWAGTAPENADLLVALPPAAVEQGDPDGMRAAVYLRDDTDGRARGDYRRVWNGVLRLFNLLQFLPGAWWTTRKGIEERLYDALDGVSDPARAPGEVEALWKEALELVAPDLLPVLEALSRGGAPPPEVGFELCGEDGVVLAEAELAWPERRVAALWPDEPEQAGALVSAGWRVVSGDADDLDGLAREIAKAIAEED